MMKILITGGGGQLATALFRKLNEDFHVLSYSKETLDVCNLQLVRHRFAADQPRYIFHCAAYTAVDECEKQPNKAFLVNTLGALNVAWAAREVGAGLMYVSTDYVFDGKKSTPYEPHDFPCPINIYGFSKWLGECLVQALCPTSHIVRTSWLYGEGQNHFVAKIVTRAIRKEKIRVVCDQKGSPTCAADFAVIARALISAPPGIYHVAGSGSCTWYEWARSIYEWHDVPSGFVIPVTSSEYRQAALRPFYSVLDTNQTKQVTGIEPRHWKKALAEYLQKEGLS